MKRDLVSEGSYVVLEKSYGFLARFIQLGMILLRIKKGKPSKYEYIYGAVPNHTEVRCGETGMYYGARGDGFRARYFDESFRRHKGKRELFYFDLGFTKKQDEKFAKVCESYDGTPYQFRNFLQHAVRILAWYWPGIVNKKKATRRMYCTEAAATVINEVKPQLFPYQYMINPREMWDRCVERLELKYIVFLNKKDNSYVVHKFRDGKIVDTSRSDKS